MPKEYFKNTLVAIFASLLVWFIFSRFFQSSNINFTIAIFGIPHFFVAALGYFANEPRKAVFPFVVATLIAILAGFILMNLPWINIIPLIFFSYFLIHLLKDEFMLEESSETGYLKMTSSWSNIMQFILIITSLSFFILLGFGISGKPIIQLPYYFIWFFLLPLPLLFSLKRKLGLYLPTGYLFFFISFLGLFFFLTGRLSTEAGFHSRAFLALYHFTTWYVFYTKRLIVKPKTKNEGPLIVKLLFSYRQSAKSFWIYVGILHALVIFMFFLYFFSPVKMGTNYLFAEGWWQFWTIWHVTTSFVGKADLKPLFSFLWPKRQKLVPYNVDADTFA